MNKCWHSKAINPPKSAWFYVRQFDGSFSSRYFDDSDYSWWLPDRNGWSPNNNFEEWFLIEECI